MKPIDLTLSCLHATVRSLDSHRNNIDLDQAIQIRECYNKLLQIQQEVVTGVKRTQ